MLKTMLSTIGCVAMLTVALPAAAGEVAQADAQRKKPLQRCDQLKDKAEIECLQKARERIVESRRKRESSGTADTVPARKAEASAASR